MFRYFLNLYTLLNGQNPNVARQQTWITDTLELAEKAGEKVSLHKVCMSAHQLRIFNTCTVKFCFKWLPVAIHAKLCQLQHRRILYASIVKSHQDIGLSTVLTCLIGRCRTISCIEQLTHRLPHV